MNNYIPFKWSGTKPLSGELTKPFERTSVQLDPHGRPVHVTLWRTDGTTLGFSSGMHDVAERREVGVLELDSVSVPTQQERFCDVGSDFREKLTASKLVIEESGIQAESGIIIKSVRAGELIIVAGAFPYTLAVRGLLSGSEMFQPEYQLGLYKQVSVT